MKAKIVKIGDKFYIKKGWFNPTYLDNELNGICWDHWWYDFSIAIRQASFNSPEEAEAHWEKFKEKKKREVDWNKQKFVKKLN